MMTCIAIDDEPKALEVIERYCQKIGLVSLKATFREPLKAIELLFRLGALSVEPQLRLPQRQRFDPAIAHAADFLCRDDSCSFQHLQVLHHGRQ